MFLPALDREGLFRIPGEATKVDEYKKRFDHGGFCLTVCDSFPVSEG